MVLIKILRGQAGVRYAVAGYYQGLWGVRQFGMYDSTRHYVANVLALKKAHQPRVEPRLSHALATPGTLPRWAAPCDHA